MLAQRINHEHRLQLDSYQELRVHFAHNKWRRQWLSIESWMLMNATSFCIQIPSLIRALHFMKETVQG
jgi:hypothetical protein